MREKKVRRIEEGSTTESAVLSACDPVGFLCATVGVIRLIGSWQINVVVYTQTRGVRIGDLPDLHDVETYGKGFDH